MDSKLSEKAVDKLLSFLVECCDGYMTPCECLIDIPNEEEYCFNHCDYASPQKECWRRWAEAEEKEKSKI